MPKELEFRLYGESHPGKVKKENEDALLVSSDLKSGTWSANSSLVKLGTKGAVVFLADGLGGQEAGPRAAELLKAHTRYFFQTIETIPEKDGERLTLLSKCLTTAHNTLLEKSSGKEELEDMGATAMLAWIIGKKAYLVWVGDTRAYLYRKGLEPHPLTDDHSLVWEMVKQGEITKSEARNHPKNNKVLQNLGHSENEPKPDGKIVNLAQDDRLMICTDGLVKALEDDEIWEVLAAEKDTKPAVKQIMNLALEGEAIDNITLALFDVVACLNPAAQQNKPPLAKKESEHKIPTKFNGAWFVLGLIIFIGLVWLILPRRTEAPIIDEIADTTKTPLGDTIRFDEMLDAPEDSSASDSAPEIQVEPPHLEAYRNLSAEFRAIKMRVDSTRLMKRVEGMVKSPPNALDESLLEEIRNRGELVKAHLNQLANEDGKLKEASNAQDVNDLKILVNQLKSEIADLFQFLELAENSGDAL